MDSGSVCKPSTRMNNDYIHQDLLVSNYYANSGHSRELDISEDYSWGPGEFCIPLLSSNTSFSD